MSDCKREYCFTCKAATYHHRGTTQGQWFCGQCKRVIAFCTRCDRVELETEAELEHTVCEGCNIELYEDQQRKREQCYLEDDRNWVEV